MPFDWLDGLSLEPNDRSVLHALLEPHEEADLAADLNPDYLWYALELSARAYSSVRRAQEELRPILGKLLIAIECNPNIYRQRGFASYDDFLSRGCPELFGLPRSEAYRAKRLMTAWPNLSPKEIAEVGSGKLYLLSKFTNGSDPKSGPWLEIARNTTADDLLDKIVAAGEIGERSEALPAVIEIQTTVAVKQFWKRFAASPQVHSAVGSDNPGAIFEKTIAEATSSWGIDPPPDDQA